MIIVQLILDKQMAREYDFPDDTPIVTIGRRPENDIQLDNIAVSGKHARLLFEAYQVSIEDLKSTNGTLLNGMPICKSTAMNPGDIVQIGKFSLKVTDNRCGIDGEKLTSTMHVPSMKKAQPDKAAMLDIGDALTVRFATRPNIAQIAIIEKEIHAILSDQQLEGAVIRSAALDKLIMDGSF
jgi:pSer/pThr/pTyr-binding forkhead associated (FHA) protein